MAIIGVYTVIKKATDVVDNDIGVWRYAGYVQINAIVGHVRQNIPGSNTCGVRTVASVILGAWLVCIGVADDRRFGECPSADQLIVALKLA